jgi:hypothetical protein
MRKYETRLKRCFARQTPGRENRSGSEGDPDFHTSHFLRSVTPVQKPIPVNSP